MDYSIMETECKIRTYSLNKQWNIEENIVFPKGEPLT